MQSGGPVRRTPHIVGQFYAALLLRNRDIVQSGIAGRAEKAYRFAGFRPVMVNEGRFPGVGSLQWPNAKASLQAKADGSALSPYRQDQRHRVVL